MQTTIYIRKENEEFWNSLGKKKSEWVNAMMQGEDIEMAYDPVSQAVAGKPIKQVLETTPEPTYAPVEAPPAPATPKLKVMTNDDLKELLGGKATQIKDEPRHTCKDTCKHWVWDTNRGGRTNTLTGEFQEGEPW